MRPVVLLACVLALPVVLANAPRVESHPYDVEHVAANYCNAIPTILPAWNHCFANLPGETHVEVALQDAVPLPAPFNVIFENATGWYSPWYYGCGSVSADLPPGTTIVDVRPSDLRTVPCSLHAATTGQITVTFT